MSDRQHIALIEHDGLELGASKLTCWSTTYHAAAKRWLKLHAKVYRDLGITFLGDDLYACQPICQAMIDEQCHFLLTCKPDSHKTLYEWVKELDTIGKVITIIIERRHGKKKFIDTYRYINQVPLRDSDDALMVNWCEL